MPNSRAIGPVTKLLVAVTNGVQVAGGEMLVHQRPCGRRHERANTQGHELAVPVVELSAAVARQRLQLEVEEFVDVQRAGLVLLV